MSLKRFAIFGGSGYIGLRLARILLKSNERVSVVLFDVRPAKFEKNDEDFLGENRLKFVRCEIDQLDSFLSQLDGIDAVFHLASYGMSGREMLDKDRIQKVNLIGTKNILQACRLKSIRKLIYCSTYNTVFAGNRPLINVTEDQCSYPKDDDFSDEYSRTKSLAERLVLQENSNDLFTAAIRPAAIYGDGEMRHLPRLLNLARQGLAFFAVGDQSILCDWVYADNLIEALILAEKSLPKHAGQAYFISDDNPVNNFEFLSQLTKGLGYENCFRYYIPTVFMFYLGFFIEIMHFILSRTIYDFTPFLSRAEVLKVGVTHYANITKAKELLGYRVQTSPNEAMKRCIVWFDKNGFRNENKTRKSMIVIFSVFVVFVLLLLYRYLSSY